MTGLKWRLEVINLNDIEAKKYGGDRFLNTEVENFFTLSEVWTFLGFKLHKERCGYSGMRNNIEYILTRRTTI